MVAALGLGPQRVGAEALAEGFASLGMLGLTAEDWAQVLGASERGEAPTLPWERLGEMDGLEQMQRAGDEELVRARTVLISLRSFYAIYMLHGLFMPDTPRPAAMRAPIDARGLGPVLDRIISLSPTHRQCAEGLTACLGGILDELYEALMEQLAADLCLFRIPGDEHGAAGFIDTWTRTLQEQTRPTSAHAP
ncbi:hypothetical protein H4W23_01010 [Streptomyces gardneri]|uniref:hypothetical protein n=1 Tax=Streptomyces gardneri TaxID=66892 RepID=UPI0006E18E94|nr:hypothetical protein [Streptomyces gardneri]QPK43354.1 hypothetical protein H4W23_01010 [Streptomyces gardneri]WRK34576.1 hypothetical protein U0M97_01010 [Streptomyces venezuelae]